MNSQDVITTHVKEERDKIYHDLRENGNDLERQVVRFSSYEPVYIDEVQDVQQVWYERGKKFHLRSVYRSTWSLAYPRT